MEKVLPKCQCGADVHVDVVSVPYYSEDGDLLGEHPEPIYSDTCLDCYYISRDDNSSQPIWNI